MVASPIFKLAGKLASNLASRSGSGLARMEKIFGTPPRVPSPTTIEKIARSDEAFARGPVEYSRYRGPMEDVDEVILDAPLNISEREYFRNLPRTGSGFTEKKLTAKDVEFFEDMMREVIHMISWQTFLLQKSVQIKKEISILEFRVKKI